MKHKFLFFLTILLVLTLFTPSILAKKPSEDLNISVTDDNPFDIKNFKFKAFEGDKELKKGDIEWVRLNETDTFWVEYIDGARYDSDGKLKDPLSNITFRVEPSMIQNKMCSSPNSYFTICSQDVVSFDTFRGKNNITNETITPVYPVSNWDAFFQLILEGKFPFWDDMQEYMTTPYAYDVTFYGTIDDLDPEIITVYSTSSSGFFNQTEATLNGLRFDAPVLFMDFNNPPEGTYVQDNSIENNFGINNGSIYNTTCDSPAGGGCYIFDGIDDEIIVEDNSILEGMSELTIGVWVYPDPGLAGTNYVSKWGSGASTSTYRFGTAIGKKLFFSVYGEGGSKLVFGNSDLVDNQWSYVTAIYDGVTVSTYINGVLDNSAEAVTGDLQDVATNLIIGGSDASAAKTFNGSIDHVQIWDRALSVYEVIEIYNGSTTGKNGSDFIGKYSSEGDFKNFVFFNQSSTYWDLIFNLADSNGSAEVFDLCQNDNNCISYWPLDDSQGSNVYADAKGNNDGTTPIGTNNATGLSSGALRFDGIDDQIFIPNSDSLNLSLVNEITMSAWINVPNNAVNELNILRKQSEFEMSIHGSASALQIRTHLFNSTGGEVDHVTGAGALQPEVWQHVVVTYNQTEVSIYINGVRNSSESHSGFFATTSSSLTISGTRIFNGTIDEVLLLNDSLTTKEIQDLYKAGLSQHAVTNITLQTRNADSYNISDSGLVSLWGLNNDSSIGENGTFVVDSTGTNNGTVVGAVWSEENGTVGGGYNFDGSSDYIDMGDQASLDGFTEGMSSCVWFKRNGLGTFQRIFNKWFTTGDQRSWVMFFDSSNRIEFDISSDGGSVNIDAFTSTNTFTDTDWHQMCLIWQSGQRIKVYIDATEEAGAQSGSAQSSIKAGTDDFYISGRKQSGNQHFDGSLDEVRIYNRTLSQAEVQNLYELGSHHINWIGGEGNFTDAGVMLDGVPTSNLVDSTFMQFKAIFNSNQTTQSPYLLNHSVDPGDNPFITPTFNISIGDPQDFVANNTNTTYRVFVTNLSNLSICVYSLDDFSTNFSMVIDNSFNETNGTDLVKDATATGAIQLIGNYTADFWCNNTDSHTAINFKNYSVLGIPTQDPPTLNATDGPTNSTFANLTCNDFPIFAGFDGNKTIFNWYKNNISLQVLNMPFEGGSTSIFTKDYSPFSINGNVSGATWNSTGGYDGKGAYEFDGVDDFIDLGKPVELEFNITDLFTLCAWVRVTETDSSYDNFGRLFSTDDGGGTNGYRLFYGRNNERWEFQGPQTTGGNGVVGDLVNEDTWTHVCGLTNDTDVVLYINGNISNSSSIDTQQQSSYAGITSFCIGRRCTGSGNEFKGSVDDVQIFNQSLSSEQIAAIYNNKTNTIVSQETTLGDEWTCEATLNSVSDSETLRSNDLTIINLAPTQDTPILNSTLGTNLTSENLTCNNISTFDANGDPVKNIFNWYKNNISLQVLNLPFEGGSNATFTRDYSQPSNNGTVVNATWDSTEGYDGKGAYQFDGVDNYINLSFVDTSIYSDELTLSTWINITNYGSQKYIFSTQVGATGFSLYVDIVEGYKAIVKEGNGWTSCYTFTGNISDENEWINLVMVYNGSSLRILRNGVQVSIDNNCSGDIEFGASALYSIGSVGGTSNFFNGTIDDILLFNYSLTDAQILAIYNNKTNIIVSQETTIGENWTCEVTPNDGFNDGITKQSNILEILPNTVPTQDTPILNSTLGTNLTTENLTCYNQSTFDFNGDLVKNIFNWYKNNNSLQVLNMPFEGGSNNTFTKDYSQFSTNVTSANNVTWNSTGGYDGKGAYEFDSTINGSMTIITNITRFNSTENRSYSFWIFNKGGNTDFNTIIKEGPGNTDGISIYFFSSGTELSFFDVAGVDDISITGGNSVPVNNWTYVTFTYDGGDGMVKAYINGVNVDAGSTGTPTSSTGNILLGYADNLNVTLNGTLDDVQIFNEALTAEQILAIYNNKTNTIVSQETFVGENWTCEITPNDGFGDGIAKRSNNLTIENTPSSITNVIIQNQSGIINGTIIKNDNVTINATIIDVDGLTNVWIDIWDGAIGISSVLFNGLMSLISGDLWSIDVNTNKSFNLGENNFTIYANDSVGDITQVNGTFSMNESWDTIQLIKINVPEFTFNSPTYTTGGIVTFNTSVPNSQLGFIGTANIRNAVGGSGSVNVFINISLDGTQVYESFVRTITWTAGGVDTASIGIPPVSLFVPSTGEHNVSVEWRRTGTNRPILINNTDALISRFVFERSQLPSETTFSGVNITFQNTSFQEVFLQETIRISNVSTFYVSQYLFSADQETVVTCNYVTPTGSSPYVTRYLEDANDVGNVGIYHIDTEKLGTHNSSLYCRATNNATVNIGGVLATNSMGDTLENFNNANQSSNPLTNLTSNITLGAGTHLVHSLNFTIKDSPESILLAPFVSFSSTTGAQTPTFFFNVTQVNESDCYSRKDRYLSSNDDVGEAYVFHICANGLVQGQTYELNMWVEIDAGETLEILDESISALEVSSVDIATQNTPLVVAILVPLDGDNVTGIINISWVVSDTQGDNYNSNITANNGTDTINILLNQPKPLNNATWNTSTVTDGLWNITGTAHENETIDLFSGNNTIQVLVDNTAPSISNVSWQNASGVINGTVYRGRNFTINATVIDDGVGISSVWINVWQGAIGISSILFEGFLSLIGVDNWSTNIVTNDSFNLNENNFTIYSNDTFNHTNQVDSSFNLDPNIVCPQDMIGNGTSILPCLVTTCTQLQGMEENLTAVYHIANTIDCSDTINWNSGAGFDPVGTLGSPFDCTVKFCGVLDGRNNTVNDLYINRTSNNVGLFGLANNELKNLGLINVSITGASRTGGLVGFADSTKIENSYVTGNITSTSIDTGGLIGRSQGATLDNAYSKATVKGVGQTGGLVGWASGTINNTYSVGNVNGTSNVGGLIGFFSSGSVINSFATGNIYGTSNLGGLVGSNSGNINNSYWNNHSGNPGQCYNGGDIGCTAIQDNQSYFEGNVYPANEPMTQWPFFSIWGERLGDTACLIWEPNCANITIFELTVNDPVGTYTSGINVPLNFSVVGNSSTIECLYSLNGASNVSVTDCSLDNYLTFNGSNEGPNTMTIFVNDSNGVEAINTEVFDINTQVNTLLIFPTEKTYTTTEDINITGECKYTNGTLCGNEVSCRVTSWYPNETLFFEDAWMTLLSQGLFNYERINSNIVGYYSSSMTCYNGLEQVAAFTFSVGDVLEDIINIKREAKYCSKGGKYCDCSIYGQC